MSNLTDALIAAKLMGNGGGGGGGGLPPISTETVTTFDEDVEIEEGGSAGAATQAVGVGENVTVSWAGTTYSCVTSEVSEGGQTAVVFGNLSIAGMGEDTGEPFLFIQMQSQGMVGYNILSSVPDGTYHVTVSAVTQSPAEGSILIVENGEWAEKGIEDCLPTLPSVKRIGGYINSTVTIAANAGATLSFTASNSVSGHYEFLHGFIANGENDVRPLIFGYGGMSDGVISITAHNASSSSITLTSGQAYLDAWYVKMDEA